MELKPPTSLTLRTELRISRSTRAYQCQLRTGSFQQELAEERTRSRGMGVWDERLRTNWLQCGSMRRR